MHCAGARIGVLQDFLGSEDIHQLINAAAREAADLMRSLGAEVVDFSIPDLADLTAGMGTSDYETRIAMNAYLARSGDGAPFTTLDSGKVDPVIEKSLRSAVGNEGGMEDPAYQAIFRKRDELQKAVLAAMAENDLDAILYPHQRRLVAPAGESQLERNGAPSNATGFPAITFPGGFAEATDTAPIGMELLGRLFAEGELNGLAYAFERGVPLLAQD